MGFVSELKEVFEQNRNPEYAIQMKAYMKNNFEFFGIKANERRALLKPIETKFKDELKEDVRPITKDLYARTEREFHLCGMELTAKYLKRNYLKEDLEFIEFLIVTNSWWDTVDFIAKNILGRYIEEHPQMRPKMLKSFKTSNDLWLNRSTLLFQLGYKNKTDEALLFGLCEYFSDREEFFIRKAIGWSLREYAKVRPRAVLNFVNSTQLKSLSTKEAIRNIK